ncbi:alpha/beta fold hydrolase [Lacinutrix sp. Hel_I_90]|uniref:alpha/beta hydrolase family protein n=1 Tax=Lacinutrix sp. Hel_I_90 TaxID=1249999 RepID=UPI0005CB670C|nr:alpha/beta fold hydrolase [Lacinutrix sp. Hel_I_90]
MSVHYFEIEINGERRVSVSKFEPQRSNAKSIVISSATGVIRKYYTKFAAHFSILGFTVYTFDYSGIGNSEAHTIKKNTCNLNDWAKDQAEVLAFAKTTCPEHKVILLTHSIGGQLIGLNPNIGLADAIIMVCSQSGYWKLFKGYSRLRMYAFWNVMIPITTPLFGYFPAKILGLFENLPKHVTYQWRKWGVKPDYMLSEFNTSDLYFKNVKCHVLSLSFPRDQFAPKLAVDWLTDRFENATVDRQHLKPEALNIDDVQHFGFFRKRFKTSLWKLAEDWIEKHT